MSIPSEGQTPSSKPVTLENLIGQMELANSRVFDMNEQLDEIANRIYGGSPQEKINASADAVVDTNISNQLNYLQDQLRTLEIRVARVRGEQEHET